MPGNGKVFISHAHDDNERCAPLLAALDAWGVDYWFDTQQLDAGQALTERIQRAIAERDVFVRIRTPAAQRSFWMTLEAGAFSSLRADDRRRHTNRRRSIDLMLGPGYDRGSAPAPDVTIDATDKAQADAFKALRGALGLDTTNRRVSRRTVLRLSAAAGAGAIAIAAAGTIFATQRARQLAALASPERGTPAINAAVQHLPEDGPQILWHVDFGAGANPSFALAAGVIYVNAPDAVYALAERDGSILWRNPAVSANAISGVGIAAAGGRVYACTSNGPIFALNASDGRVLWNVLPGGPAPSAVPNGLNTTPVVAADVMYLHASDHHLYALRTGDGSVLWQAAFNAEDAATIKGAPAIVNGVVYAGSLDGNVYAFDAASGAPRWKFATGDSVRGIPAVANGIVYIGSENKSFYALDALSGALIWQQPLLAPGLAGASPLPVGTVASATVAGGLVYIGDDAGFVHAFDAVTGGERWQQLTYLPTQTSGTPTPGPTPIPPASSNPISCQPLVSGAVVYVNANAAIFAFKATDGSLVFKAADGSPLPGIAIDRNVSDLPLVALDGGVLYVSASSSILALAAPAGQ